MSLGSPCGYVSSSYSQASSYKSQQKIPLRVPIKRVVVIHQASMHNSIDFNKGKPPATEESHDSKQIINQPSIYHHRYNNTRSK